KASGPIALIKAERYEYWHRAAKVTSIYPLTGLGIGAYKTEIPNIMRWGSPTYRENAANYYLQLSSELGLIGLAIMLLLLASLVRKAWNLSRNSDDLADSIPFVLVAVMLLAFMTGPHTNSIDVM